MANTPFERIWDGHVIKDLGLLERVMNHHFGVLIPSTNTTVEIEYSRLLPPTLQAHVGRLKSSGTGPFAPASMPMWIIRRGCSARRRWR